MITACWDGLSLSHKQSYLSEGGFNPTRPEDWSSQPDPWETKMREDAFIFGDFEWFGCIPADQLAVPPTEFFLRRIVYYGRDNPTDAMAMWYHPPTRRLLFVNWST